MKKNLMALVLNVVALAMGVASIVPGILGTASSDQRAAVKHRLSGARAESTGQAGRAMKEVAEMSCKEFNAIALIGMVLFTLFMFWR